MRKSKRIAALFMAAASLTALSACARKPDVPTMEDAFALVDTIVTNDVKNGFPSAQIAVIHEGELVYSDAWGDVTTDTLFDLASNTKMYSVVYAVQHLITEEQLTLDTRIAEILGDRFADDTEDIAYTDGAGVSLEQNKEWKRSLTVRDVLSHRAGFPADPRYFLREYDFASQTRMAGAENPLYVGYDGSAETRERTLDAICRTPLMYEPGGKVLYSDADYMLMAFVLEELTGMPLDQYVKETFYEPMGLTHITFNPLQNGFEPSDCAPTELHGNTRDGAVSFEGVRTETLRGEVHDEKAWYCMGGVSGHAGLFSNAEDLAWLAYTMIDGTAGGVRYFDESVIETFSTPVKEDRDDWGVGWWRQGNLGWVNYFGTHCPENTIGHQGWTGTLSVIDREEKLVIVILTNKISSPVTDPVKNPDMFDGNHYITSKLGFATQLIYDGLLGIPFDEDLNALVEKMQKQAEDDPCEASERALRSIQKTVKAYK